MTTTIQGTIATIKTVIQAIGPATARQIETHPEVVAACRSSKAKARRLIERLHTSGNIKSDMAAQQPKFWVEDCTKEACEWDYKDMPPAFNPITISCPGSHESCFTLKELAKEFGVKPRHLWERVHKDPNAPQRVPIKFQSRRRDHYYRGSDMREWWNKTQSDQPKEPI